MTIALLPIQGAVGQTTFNRGTDNSCPPDVQNAFTDDEGNVHEANINCVAHWEIALGTSDTSYSPGASVTRAQMATFIANEMETAGYTFADSPDDAFTDDDGNTHEANINKLAAAGVVSGTGENTYSPGATVTRAQMATFINNAIEAVTGTALSSTEDFFSDDNGNTHEANINAIASEGIVQGDAAGDYNPGNNVTRAQMATFLASAGDYLATEGHWPSFSAFQVTPSDAAVLTTSTATGTNATRGQRSYSASVGDASKVSLALVPTGNVTASGSTISFLDVDGNANRADGLGTTNGRFDSINGVATGNADGGDFAANVVPNGGVVNFTTNSQTANTQFIPVVWVDADNNGFLNLDANNEPTEDFGIGGATTLIPPEAALGNYAGQSVALIFADAEPTPFFTTATATYYLNTTYTYTSGAVNQTITQANFLDWLSGPANNSTGITDAVGDTVNINYNPGSGTSAFELAVDLSNAPTALTATVTDTDADASNDDVALSWTAPTNPDVTSYNVWRASVSSGVVGTYANIATVTGKSNTAYNDQSVTPTGTYSYRVTAVNGDGGDDGAQSGAVQATVTAAANTNTPVSTATNFATGPTGGTPADDANVLDKGDSLDITFTNANSSLPLTVSSPSVVVRDGDGTTVTLNTTNADFTLATPSATNQVLSITLTSTPTPSANGSDTVFATNSTGAIISSSGISNANGPWNLARSGCVGGAAGCPAGSFVRVFGNANPADNTGLPNAVPSNTTEFPTVNPSTDQIQIRSGASNIGDGETFAVYDKNGTMIASGTYSNASGNTVTTSPGFDAGATLFFVYTDRGGTGNAFDRLPSESTVIPNPAVIPNVTGVSGTGTSIDVTWNLMVTQTGPAGNYTVYDSTNSSLVATATNVSPTTASTTKTLTLDTALTTGMQYNLRVAANTVQGPDNTPNNSIVFGTWTAAAAANTAPTITKSGGPDGTTTNDSTPTWVGSTSDSDGTVAQLRAQVDGGTNYDTTTGATNGWSTGAALPTASTTWSWTAPSALSEGAHTVQFFAWDDDGATASTAVINFTVGAAAPTIQSVTTDPSNNRLVVTFSEETTCPNTANAQNAWSFTNGNGAGTATGSPASVTDAASGVCYLNYASVVNGDYGTLDYSQPAGASDQVQDAQSTPLATTTGNNVTDSVAPTYDSVAATGGSTTVTLTFSEDIQCSSVVAGDFTVTYNGVSQTVNSVTCTGTGDTTIDLTMASAPTAGQNVTVTLSGSVNDESGDNSVSGTSQNTLAA